MKTIDATKLKPGMRIVTGNGNEGVVRKPSTVEQTTRTTQTVTIYLHGSRVIATLPCPVKVLS